METTKKEIVKKCVGKKCDGKGGENTPGLSLSHIVPNVKKGIKNVKDTVKNTTWKNIKGGMGIVGDAVKQGAKNVYNAHLGGPKLSQGIKFATDTMLNPVNMWGGVGVQALKKQKLKDKIKNIQSFPKSPTLKPSTPVNPSTPAPKTTPAPSYKPIPKIIPKTFPKPIEPKNFVPYYGGYGGKPSDGSGWGGEDPKNYPPLSKQPVKKTGKV